MLLGFVLGRLMEENLRQAMSKAGATLLSLFESPLAGSLLAFAAILLVIAVLPSVSKSRDEVFTE